MSIALHKSKRRIPITVAFVIAGLLLSLRPLVTQALAEPLRIGFPRDISAGLIYLADSQGFFKKRGTDIVMKEYESGSFALNDLVADKLDLATAGEFAFVVQSFRHTDLRVSATICVLSVIELVVRKDRGITRPDDLRGKRVAVTRYSAGEFFFYNYLIFNRIPAGSVHVVYQTPSEMVKAMADGTIDAAIAWPPYTSEMMKQLGANGTRWPAQSGQDYYFALVAKETFLRKQPKTMEQFLAALSDAEGFITKYPDRAQSILSARLKADAGSFSETWSRVRPQLQLSQDMVVLMEREAKWAMRSKLVEQREMPNYLDFFYFNALDKVKPEGVSIVH